jgi:hypothetical protein
MMSRRRYKPTGYSAGGAVQPADVVEVTVPRNESPTVHVAAAPDTALARQLDELRRAEEVVRQHVAAGLQPLAADPIDRLPHASAAQRQWLKDHRDAFDDPRKLAHLGAAHHDALAERIEPDSAEYFRFLETRLGYRTAEPRLAGDPLGLPPIPVVPAARGPVVSAPVSRSGGASYGSDPLRQGRVVLTAEEREAARLSGVSDREYAVNKLRLNERKRHGDYPGGA